MPNAYVYILADKKTRVIKTNVLSGNNKLSIINNPGMNLVYYETFKNLAEADERKKTIKSWPVEKIKFLIDFVNPEWKDWKQEIKKQK